MNLTKGSHADECRRLQAMIGDLAMDNVLLYKRCHKLEAGPRGAEGVEEMSATLSTSQDQPFGVARVCRA